jgi:hypothetical protein
MSDESDEAYASTGSFWKQTGALWLDLAISVLAFLALRFILVRFSWYQRFDTAHGFLGFLIPVVAAGLILDVLYRHKRQRREQLAYLAEIHRGNVRRMSLVTRFAIILASLGCVIAGSLLSGNNGALCAAIGVPALILFSLEELNIILRPGPTVRFAPTDELAAHFRARTLQVGYAVALLSLLTLCLIGLFASTYLVVALPIALGLSLLTPSLLYRRLDRLAGPDD